MNEVKLSVPEGYFEESLSKTLDRSRKIRTRRRAALCVAASLALIVGIWQFMPSNRISMVSPEDAELYELDVFLMINGE